MKTTCAQRTTAMTLSIDVKPFALSDYTRWSITRVFSSPTRHVCQLAKWRLRRYIPACFCRTTISSSVRWPPSRLGEACSLLLAPTLARAKAAVDEEEAWRESLPGKVRDAWLLLCERKAEWLQAGVYEDGLPDSLCMALVLAEVLRFRPADLPEARG
jgi:hypothetical protein